MGRHVLKCLSVLKKCPPQKKKKKKEEKGNVFCRYRVGITELVHLFCLQVSRIVPTSRKVETFAYFSCRLFPGLFVSGAGPAICSALMVDWAQKHQLTN